MGLQKPIVTPFGDTAEYWNIAEVTYNRMNEVLIVKLFGFATEETRRGGKQPKMAQTFTFSGLSYVEDFTISDLYSMVKGDPMFSGHQDV